MTVPFLFVGNAIWLDFVNTALCDGGKNIELLTTFDDLLRWSRQANLIDAAQERTFASAIKRTRDRAFEEALALRSDLQKGAVDMANGRPPKPALLARINSLLHEHPSALTLTTKAGRWQLSQEPKVAGPQTPAALIAEDFARFLTVFEPALLRKCAGESCQVYFYDTSKNHTRRWCSMEYCGNRAKAAGHRSRQSGDDN
jgi:predicted RNA-binding Zn ribbon-like protein